MSGALPVRDRMNQFCGHCKQFVLPRTFRDHKKKFWNEETGQYDNGVNTIIDMEDDYPDMEGDMEGDLEAHEGDKDIDGSCEGDKEIEEEGDKEGDKDIDGSSEGDKEIDDKVIDGIEGHGTSKVEIQTAFYKVLRLWQIRFSISSIAMHALMFILFTFLAFWMAAGAHGESIVLNPPHMNDAIQHGLRNLEADETDDELGIINMVCCKNCFTVYTFAESYHETTDRSNFQWKKTKVVNKCTTLVIVNFTGERRKKKLKTKEVCGTDLGVINSYNRKTFFAPFMVLNYGSLVIQLKKILSRPGFIELCNQWETRDLPPGVMGDIFEGNIWQEEKEWFKVRAELLSIGLQLNLDWFQPYTYSQYSAGAVYCCILNLPREMRNKKENIILVAMLPRASEHTNSTPNFMKPFVDELLQFLHGVVIPGIAPKVRARLICVAADLPAGRAFCGFVAVGANAGCPRCQKHAHEYGDFKNDGVFLSGNRRRTHEEHKLNADIWKSKTVKSNQAAYAKEHGSRWSHLLRLPYFDCVRFLSIDPMHCFFLGIVRFTLSKLTAPVGGVFTAKQFSSAIASLTLPRDFGRLMANYEDTMRKLTAEELMTMCLVVSDPIFKELMQGNPDHYLMWVHLSEALRGACSNVLVRNQLENVQRHLYHFFIRFESLYPRECKPNFHLAQELVLQCLPDFGPVHVTWCFAFERLNGILGSIKHNQREIEKTLMRAFMHSQSNVQYDFEFMSAPEFTRMWECIDRKYVAKAHAEVKEMLAKLSCHEKYVFLQAQGKAYSCLGYHEHPSCLVSSVAAVAVDTETFFEGDMLATLQKRFKTMEVSYNDVHPEDTIEIKVCPSWKNSAARAFVFESQIGVAGTQFEKASYIMTRYEEGEIAAQVQRFYEVNVDVKRSSGVVRHTAPMAYVRFFKIRKFGTKREEKTVAREVVMMRNTAVPKQTKMEYNYYQNTTEEKAPPPKKKQKKQKGNLVWGDSGANTIYEDSFDKDNSGNWVPLQEISALCAKFYIDIPGSSLPNSPRSFRVARMPLKLYI